MLETDNHWHERLSTTGGLSYQAAISDSRSRIESPGPSKPPLEVFSQRATQDIVK
jgi:hypothetical protein